jgi:hypothetical protein
VRTQADRLDHPANRAGLHQTAGIGGGALAVMLAVEDREDPAGLSLDPPQLGQLL